MATTALHGGSSTSPNLPTTNLWCRRPAGRSTAASAVDRRGAGTTVLAREGDHGRRGVDAEDVEARAGQLAGEDSRAAAEVHDQPVAHAVLPEDLQQPRRRRLRELAEPGVVDVRQVGPVLT